MNNDRTRILIVDDEPDHRLLIHTLLSEFIAPAPALQEASNGQEAVHLFQAWSPALILMDLWMPTMTGDLATRQIRAMEGAWRATAYDVPFSLPPVCIVAVTAATFGDDRDLAIHAGCDDVVSKPLDFEEFMSTLMGHLASINSMYRETVPRSHWDSMATPSEPIYSLV